MAKIVFYKVWTAIVASMAGAAVTLLAAIVLLMFGVRTNPYYIGLAICGICFLLGLIFGGRHVDKLRDLPGAAPSDRQFK